MYKPRGRPTDTFNLSRNRPPRSIAGHVMVSSRQLKNSRGRWGLKSTGTGAPTLPRVQPACATHYTVQIDCRGNRPPSGMTHGRSDRSHVGACSRDVTCSCGACTVDESLCLPQGTISMTRPSQGHVGRPRDTRCTIVGAFEDNLQMAELEGAPRSMERRVN